MLHPSKKGLGSFLWFARGLVSDLLGFVLGPKKSGHDGSESGRDENGKDSVAEPSKARSSRSEKGSVPSSG
jgi:hypothetical protein